MGSQPAVARLVPGEDSHSSVSSGFCGCFSGAGEIYTLFYPCAHGA